MIWVCLKIGCPEIPWFINLQKCIFFRVDTFSDKPIWRIVILLCTCCSGFFLVPDNLAINVYAPKHRFKSCMMGSRPKKQVLIVGWELNVAHETATFQNIALSFLGLKNARPFQNAWPQTRLFQPILGKLWPFVCRKFAIWLMYFPNLPKTIRGVGSKPDQTSTSSTLSIRNAAEWAVSSTPTYISGGLTL